MLIGARLAPLLLMVAVGVTAQEKQAVTFEELFDLAIKNNRELAGQRERVAEARGTIVDSDRIRRRWPAAFPASGSPAFADQRTKVRSRLKTCPTPLLQPPVAMDGSWLNQEGSSRGKVRAIDTSLTDCKAVTDLAAQQIGWSSRRSMRGDCVGCPPDVRPQIATIRRTAYR